MVGSPPPRGRHQQRQRRPAAASAADGVAASSTTTTAKPATTKKPRKRQRNSVRLVRLSTIGTGLFAATLYGRLFVRFWTAQEGDQLQQQQQLQYNAPVAVAPTTTETKRRKDDGEQQRHQRQRQQQQEYDDDAAKAGLQRQLPPRSPPPVVVRTPPRRRILTAYAERVDRTEWDVRPLPSPRSTAESDALRKMEFPNVACRNLPSSWPVNNEDGALPSDVDPYLPWIHDVFPTHDGSAVQFVAQNRRRCRTGKNDTRVLERFEPQVALFQPAPVVRRRALTNRHQYQYALAPSFEEADADSYSARFICRFQPSGQETLSRFNFDYDWATLRKRYLKGWSKEHGNNKQVHTSQLIFQCPVPPNLRETVRTGASVVVDDDGGDDAATTLFVDLVPIRTPPRFGPPDQFLQPKYSNKGDGSTADTKFDGLEAYGRDHVLPAVEDSGRWENIPICMPSHLAYPRGRRSGTDDDGDAQKRPYRQEHRRERDAITSNSTVEEATNATAREPHRHRLIACLWHSVGYKSRGDRDQIGDGRRRLFEWLHYNKLVGYDHVYVYDNSRAVYDADDDDNNGTNTDGGALTLKDITDRFTSDYVTYIDWPSKICNNNKAGDDSPGERSSQYAAESSCRLRFGPYADWIGQFDVDEYLVPMGENHTTIPDLLDDLDRQDVRVLNFQSLRARARRDRIDEIRPFRDKAVCNTPAPCFHLSVPDNTTLLQAFNCDPFLPNEKVDVAPAEKQLYRPDYVLQHFVHYSAVTTLLDENRTEYERQGFRWTRRGKDPRQRRSNERTEGLMIHAKTVATRETSYYQRQCHIDNFLLPPGKRGSCLLGMPWPAADGHLNSPNATSEGLFYNCYVNEKVEQILVPQLEKAMGIK